jgi:hypothetical protein
MRRCSGGPPSETRRAEESSFYADVAIIGCVVCRNLIHPVTSNGCPCTAHHTDGGSESNGEKRQLACPNACGRPSDAMNIRHRRGSSNTRCHRKPSHSAGSKIQKRLRTGGQFREEAGRGRLFFPWGCRTSVRRITRFRRRLMVFAAGVVQSPLNGCAIPLRVLLLLLLDRSRINRALCHGSGSCLQDGSRDASPVCLRG